MTLLSRRSLRDGDVFLFLVVYYVIVAVSGWARHHGRGDEVLDFSAFGAVMVVQGAMLFRDKPPTRRTLWFARVWAILWTVLTCVGAFL